MVYQVPLPHQLLKSKTTVVCTNIPTRANKGTLLLVLLDLLFKGGQNGPLNPSTSGAALIFDAGIFSPVTISYALAAIVSAVG